MRYIRKHKIIEKHNTPSTHVSKFSKEVLKAIEEHSVVAGVDASVKHNYMGAIYILCNEQDKHHEIGSIQSLKWKYNILKGAEALAILNFIKEVQSNIKHLCEGLIEIYNDNLKLVQAMNNGVTKVSDGACDRRSSIYEIFNTIKSM